MESVPTPKAPINVHVLKAMPQAAIHRDVSVSTQYPGKFSISGSYCQLRFFFSLFVVRAYLLIAVMCFVCFILEFCNEYFPTDSERNRRSSQIKALEEISSLEYIFQYTVQEKNNNSK